MSSRIPAANQPPHEAHERVRMTVALAVLGVFVTYVPITAVSVSLTSIGAVTGASTSDLQWVSDAYIIPMAAAVLSAGLFGELYGRRRIFSLGMILTIIGALTAGLASFAGPATLGVLWAGQAVSGLGAGLLLPTTLGLIAHAVPDFRARARYIGMWASGIVVGLAVGPLISGTILTFAGWGWIFAPTVVLAAIAGLIAHAKLPESKSPEGKHLDWPGQITATIAIAASIYGVIEGGSQGWGSAGAVLGLAVGVIGLVSFIVVEHRSSAPMMDLGLFRSWAFTAAGWAALVALFSVVGTMFLLSLFLGSVQQLSPLAIGLRLLFSAGVAAIVSPFVGRLMGSIRPILLLLAGLVLCAVAVSLLLGVNAQTGLGDFAWRLSIYGIALALMLSSVSAVAIDAAPRPQAGMAGTTNTALRQYGGALGPAVLGSVYISRMQSGSSPAEALNAAMIVNLVVVAVAIVLCVIAVAATMRKPAQTF